MRAVSGPPQLTLALLLAAAALPARAEQAHVVYRDGRFEVHSEVLIGVPTATVRAILTDFARLPQIHPGITHVAILENTTPTGLRMRVRARACVLFFCRAYRWTQRVWSPANGDLMAVIEPAESDFRAGWTRYRFQPEGQATRLRFDAELAPAFWLPPLIGPWVIKRKLLHEAETVARGIERIKGVRLD